MFVIIFENNINENSILLGLFILKRPYIFIEKKKKKFIFYKICVQILIHWMVNLVSCVKYKQFEFNLI